MKCIHFLFQRENLQELFRSAAIRQTEIMVQNILGQGLDIHLLGLREACKDSGEPLHELFTDESYKISQCFLLSTSQVKRMHNMDFITFNFQF